MKVLLLLVMLMGTIFIAGAQDGFVLDLDVNSEKISFEQHSNMIVVCAKVNNVDFNFILDTGATKTILFNLRGIDSLSINKGNVIKVKGYGDKKYITAYYSTGNKIEIGKNISNTSAEVLVLTESEIDLSPKLDVEIHGLLGVDFLKNFVTHFDYKNSYVKIYKEFKQLPSSLRKGDQFNLDLRNNRPFVKIHLDNDLIKGDFELLIDTGSGDALWVLNKINKKAVINNSFEDYLGFGLNGKVYGLRTKVASINLFNTTLKKVAVSYPYKEYHSIEKTNISHDGSLGGEILRRFDMIIDFPNKKISMLPNRFFNEGFYYNMSGLGVQKGEIELYTQIGRDFSQDKVGYGNDTSTKIIISSNVKLTYQYVPSIFIDYVRKDSPGDKAGIEIGDQIISINGYNKKELTINKVSEFFFKNPFKKLKIKLKRGDQEFKVEIINIPLVF